MMERESSVEKSQSETSRKRREEFNNEDTGGKIPKSETGAGSCWDRDRDEDQSSIHELITFQPSHLPARHYDLNTTEPLSYALNTLEQLLSWKLSDANPFNMATCALEKRRPSLKESSMRTLVCHDMMGGYLHDRFVQGTEVDDPYVFYHWNNIDIFNYFSHHMVTIPPAAWTNAAHKHAVHCLGTFITEWEEGQKVCERFLVGEEEYRAVADKLVQISHCYGFDGWLINIENTLSANSVKHVAPFLRYLTDQMHERIPDSLVIWYDSVLDDGTLNWQNQLNNRNRVFFDTCDGIFTNYNWTEDSLEDMESDPVSQQRLADVYVGIDVFARGEVIGGKFDTNKALQLVRKHGFSTAIFAPGWVYECHEKQDFRKNQDKFWGLLSDVLYPHRPVCPLPFVSSFCQGFGKSFYWRGKVEQDRSWFNLSAQQPQPLYTMQHVDDGGWIRTRGCSQDAWTGGGALVLEGKLPKALPKISARIFSFHVALGSRTFISMVFKLSDGVDVSLELKTADADLCADDGRMSSVVPVVLDDDDEMVQQVYQGDEGQRADSWIIRCFQLEQNPPGVLTELCVCVSRGEAEAQDLDFSCRIGEITVLDAQVLDCPPSFVQNLCVSDVQWRKHDPEGKVCLSATLRWHYPTRVVRYFRVFWRRLRGPDPRVGPGSRVLIGRAYGGRYRVVDLELEHTHGVMELLVEPVNWRGNGVPESYWGRQRLSYTH